MRLPELRCCLAALLACGAWPSEANANNRHVVVVVWDGMRPDFVTEQNCPTLYQLARRGVTFAHHHSVYPSATEVNGTAISTGAYPVHDRIIANHEYRPNIDSLKPVRTESPDALRRGDELTQGNYLGRLTLAEIVRRNGRKAVVAGAKPVVLLADRGQRSSPNVGMNVFAGSSLPASLADGLTNRFGPFPKEDQTNPARNDWTTKALTEVLWADGVPAFSLLWMNEPDASQHRTSPGSAESLAAIRNADENLTRVLKALEAKGMRDRTDLLVVSDHGFSTVSTRVDVAAALQKGGLNAVREFKSKPVAGDLLVVSNGGSTLVYVIGHGEELVQQIVRFFQRWEFTGVIFTRKQMPGTFELSQVHLDSASSPDVAVSLRWSAENNKNATAGMVVADVSSYGPGQGLHVTLSPFDMHATLVAAGPDFHTGIVNTLASGNVDVAPTVLWLLDMKPPQKMDGRVLSEALSIKGPKITAFEPRHLESTFENHGVVWHQYLNITQVNGVDYVDEGNGY